MIDGNRIKDRSLGLPNDIVRHVKGHEEKREQGCDGQHDVVLHRAIRDEVEVARRRRCHCCKSDDRPLSSDQCHLR